ncbi:MAG: SDR family oxidoreductase [Methylotetracoccus sp.]|jgi:NAD(P)-dependent dehydrogenase (short-subunit alcohol dehydrogenase family)|nr:SDR family oxidoreductase [Methylotetracoccus sp.]
MPTVLVTGANRGLGLEFCRQYANEGWNVLACCRSPETATRLTELERTNPTVHVHRLDVSDLAAIDRLGQSLRGTVIDVLINNAGVYGDTASTAFGRIDYARWLEVLRINSLAPVKMTETFLDHLRSGERRLTVAITSLMGSIGDNTSGGAILYRSSKAALNAAMKSLSFDLRGFGIGVLMLHPGWVRTDMGGTNAPLDVMASVGGMRQVIDHYHPSLSGQFLNYCGESEPW